MKGVNHGANSFTVTSLAFREVAVLIRGLYHIKQLAMKTVKTEVAKKDIFYPVETKTRIKTSEL